MPNGICPEKPVQNMHYLSSFDEYASVQIKKTDTDEDIVRFYAKHFPKEAKEFQSFIKLENDQLAKSSGMSKGGTIMRIGSIPEFIRVSMQYLYGLDYWNRPNAMTKFVRRFKGFAVGDHSKKDTKGTIVK